MDYNYINNLIENMPIAMAITDGDGLIISVNLNMLNIFGYDKGELLNMPISNLFEGFYGIRDDVLSKNMVIDREVYVHSRINKLRLSVSAYPIYHINRESFDIIFIFEDVKRERKLSDKILENKAVYTFDKIISQNRELLRIIEFAKKISDSKSTVLISGETGTGKEVFAQSIHNESDRRDKAFIAINSAAIPENLIESELFGYVEGAFTGAKKSGQAGKFELADKGTIFLDEIGEMPLKLQTRLLRVIEEGIVTRVGGTDQIIVDVRIIAASNKNLRKQVVNGSFRKDLYYRLNVLPLDIPPLRERKDDIPLLSDFFMEKISRRLNKRQVKLNDDTLNKMMNHDWPGNIRELENLIEFIINLEYVPDKFFDDVKDEKKEMIDIYDDYSLEEIEKNHIIKILKLYDGNISKASEALEIGRNTLYRKMDKYNINILF